MLDVRWHVLVMRMRAGKIGLIRARLRIVPAELFAVAPDFVAVTLDQQRPFVPDDDLCYDQPVAMRKVEFAYAGGKAATSSGHGEGGVQHTGIALLQAVDEALVLTQGLEWIHAGQSSR